jgi:hypothetical protein
MGLDMFAFATKAKPKTEVDFETKNFDPEEIHYWRKHPNLHGWMENLYRDKGGDKHSDFNGECVVLTLNDLEDLEHDLKQFDLPDTSGFFFGQSQTNEEELKDDLEFVTKAREHIKEGRTVYYTSWW